MAHSERFVCRDVQRASKGQGVSGPGPAGSLNACCNAAGVQGEVFAIFSFFFFLFVCVCVSACRRHMQRKKKY